MKTTFHIIIHSNRNFKALQDRFGIDSDEVIVGDIVGEKTSDTETVTGMSPNLAARLQQIAEPGQIVIGSNTRDLSGITFELSFLGNFQMKGFAQEMPAWSVIGEKEAETRFEAARGLPGLCL